MAISNTREINRIQEPAFQQKRTAGVFIASLSAYEVGDAVVKSLKTRVSQDEGVAIKDLADRNLLSFKDPSYESSVPFLDPTEYLIQFFKLSAWAELARQYQGLDIRGYNELLEAFGGREVRLVHGLIKFYRDRFSMWPIFRAFAAAYGSDIENLTTEAGKNQTSYRASIAVADRFVTPAKTPQELQMRLKTSFAPQAARFSGRSSIFKELNDERKYKVPQGILQSSVVTSQASRDFKALVYDEFAAHIENDVNWIDFSTPFIKSISSAPEGI